MVLRNYFSDFIYLMDIYLSITYNALSPIHAYDMVYK